ncbi:unnamed protein product [Prorocentrum cordatum]|uniref:Uncharacterized protein n=1 Tax=Prorocentrum cordatum TaxID=2364126 RepID=A0ABN9X0J9_9DINO|nr:unnamed protein product [Polarella glacialis]
MTSFPTLEFDLGGNLLSLPPDAYMAAVVGTDRARVPRAHRRPREPGGRPPFPAAPAGRPRGDPSQPVRHRARRRLLGRRRRRQPVQDAAHGVVHGVRLWRANLDIWIHGSVDSLSSGSTTPLSTSEGEDASSRALYLAEASDDCRPAETSSLARSLPHLRRIDISKLAATPLRVGHSKVRRI